MSLEFNSYTVVDRELYIPLNDNLISSTKEKFGDHKSKFSQWALTLFEEDAIDDLIMDNVMSNTDMKGEPRNDMSFEPVKIEFSSRERLMIIYYKVSYTSFLHKSFIDRFERLFVELLEERWKEEVPGSDEGFYEAIKDLSFDVEITPEGTIKLVPYFNEGMAVLEVFKRLTPTSGDEFKGRLSELVADMFRDEVEQTDL